MQFRNVTIEDMSKALEMVNARYDGNIAFKSFDRYGSKITATLKTKTGLKRNEDGYIKGKTKNLGNGHYKASACWHVHGWFFEYLLQINPKAVIVSSWYGYREISVDGGNWQNKEMGTDYSGHWKLDEACDCYEWDNVNYEEKEILNEPFNEAFTREPLPHEEIKLKVHQDYDALDALAEKYGFKAIEGNLRLSGWIPTMGDAFHSVIGAINEANTYLKDAQQKYKDAVIGLCQTGNFSVGYTIYVKE